MRRVLVIRLTAMGDVAMTAPVVLGVADANPEVQFDVLSTPFFAPFYAPRPNVRFLGTNIRRERSGFMGLFRLWRQLRADKVASAGGAKGQADGTAIAGADKRGEKFQYTDVVDLHDVIRSQVLRTLFSLTGCHMSTLDKGRQEKARLVSGEEFRQLPHMTERYAEAFRRAGLRVPATFPTRPREPIPKACQKYDRDKELWIGIAPFAQHIGKMYRHDWMHETLLNLVAEYPTARLFVFGGGIDEQASAVVLCQGVERCHNMIRVMPLQEEMALVSNLDLMFSMDSAMQHISSLYGVRVVSLWGETHPYAGFLGWGQSMEDVVQREDLDCRPCSIFGNKQCAKGRYPCTSIDTNLVMEHLRRAIGECVRD